MQDRIGFIGVGAMGEALLKGLIERGVRPSQILASDAKDIRINDIISRYGIEAVTDNRNLAKSARIIFLAIKPQDIASVLDGIKDTMTDKHLIVSVAAGVSIASIERRLGGIPGVIRVMPNTPCLVTEGAMGLSRGSKASDEDLELIKQWLNGIGVVRQVPEKLLDAVTGLSGSGPAYVYLLIESLSDGGVLSGLPREMATELAVQTVLGSAKMVKETGEHPAILREKVTSPGGTTAAALYALEDGGMRAAVIKAVRAAALRSKELGD